MEVRAHSRCELRCGVAREAAQCGRQQHRLRDRFVRRAAPTDVGTTAATSARREDVRRLRPPKVQCTRFSARTTSGGDQLQITMRLTLYSVSGMHPDADVRRKTDRERLVR